jgi:hypothetical protein
MGKAVNVIAVVMFVVGVGFGLYNDSAYKSFYDRHTEQTSLREEFHRLGAKFGYCPADASGKYVCPTERMNELFPMIGYEYHILEREMKNAKEIRNISFAFAVLGPLAIYMFRAFWQSVVAPGARKGAQVSRIAAEKFGEKLGEGAARAASAAAKITDNAQGRTRECPFCAEMIKPHANICHHCGKEVT